MKKSCIVELYFADSVKNMPTSRHRHHLYQMIYVKKGAIRFVTDGASYDCVAPSLLFVNSLEPHATEPYGDVYERYVLSLDPSRVSEIVKPSHLLTVFSVRNSDFLHCMDVRSVESEVDFLFSRLFAEFSSESDDRETGEEIWLSALLHALYRYEPAFFSPDESRIGKIVLSLRSEIERNFSQNPSLREIAARHYVNHYYLSHVFKTVTGYSVKQYRLLCCLSYACELLSESDKRVSEIADAVGFNDTSNFIRYFRKKYGMTPTEYRRKMKENQ